MKQWANKTDGITYYVNARVPPEKFITNCSVVFGAVSCPASRLTFTRFGACYTLDPVDYEGKTLASNFAGPESSFSFELNVHQNEYNSQTYNKALGAVVSTQISGAAYRLFCFDL